MQYFFLFQRYKYKSNATKLNLVNIKLLHKKKIKY